MTYFLCVFRVFARLLASSCQSGLALTKQLIFNSGTGEKCVFILITPGRTTLDCVCNVSDSPRSQMSHHVRNRFCEAILSVVYHHKRESLWIWESNSCLDCSENIWLIQIQNIQNQNWKSCCRLTCFYLLFEENLFFSAEASQLLDFEFRSASVICLQLLEAYICRNGAFIWNSTSELAAGESGWSVCLDVVLIPLGCVFGFSSVLLYSVVLSSCVVSSL